MTDVNSVNQMLAAMNSATGGSDSSTRNTSGTIGKDDFLKLLVGQLQHQDPMAPSGDSDFIGQMAQFSQLEQETNTAQSTGTISDQLARSSALGLIGHTVSYTDADKNVVSGTVTQVDVDSTGKSTLTVDGKGGIDAGSVTQVK